VPFATCPLAPDHESVLAWLTCSISMRPMPHRGLLGVPEPPALSYSLTAAPTHSSRLNKVLGASTAPTARTPRSPSRSRFKDAHWCVRTQLRPCPLPARLLVQLTIVHARLPRRSPHASGRSTTLRALLTSVAVSLRRFTQRLHTRRDADRADLRLDIQAPSPGDRARTRPPPPAPRLTRASTHPRDRLVDRAAISPVTTSFVHDSVTPSPSD
jgi:hypothetical protein